MASVSNIKQRLTFFSLPVSCTPTNVKASLRCYSNSAAVTWEPASGALSYVAVGVTTDGSQRIECNNTMPYCDLSNLQCGQTYNVSVFGHDESCNSTESNKTNVRTGIMSMSGSKFNSLHFAVWSYRRCKFCNFEFGSCFVSQLPVHPRTWLLIHNVLKVPWSSPGLPTLTYSISLWQQWATLERDSIATPATVNAHLTICPADSATTSLCCPSEMPVKANQALWWKTVQVNFSQQKLNLLYRSYLFWTEWKLLLKDRLILFMCTVFSGV